MNAKPDVPLGRLSAQAYEIPTDGPEADGTLTWDRTTLVLVEVQGGGEIGLGYTYADASIVGLIEGLLATALACRSAFDVGGATAALRRQVRNQGRSGLAASAISAVDTALWDLKSKLLGISLASLLGRCRDAIPVYGSGGFTNYPDDLEGLCLLREHAPAGMDIAAGEYIYTPDDARRLLAGPAIDVLQADLTRCGGISGFLHVAALCEARHVDLSGHCAPALHLHAACAAPGRPVASIVRGRLRRRTRRRQRARRGSSIAPRRCSRSPA